MAPGFNMQVREGIFLCYGDSFYLISILHVFGLHCIISERVKRIRSSHTSCNVINTLICLL